MDHFLRFLARNPSITALVLIVSACLLDAVPCSGDDATSSRLSAALALAGGHVRGKKQSTAVVSSVAASRPQNIIIKRHTSTAATPTAGDLFSSGRFFAGVGTTSKHNEEEEEDREQEREEEDEEEAESSDDAVLSADEDGTDDDFPALAAIMSYAT